MPAVPPDRQQSQCGRGRAEDCLPQAVPEHDRVLDRGDCGVGHSEHGRGGGPEAGTGKRIRERVGEAKADGGEREGPERLPEGRVYVRDDAAGREDTRPIWVLDCWRQGLEAL